MALTEKNYEQAKRIHDYVQSVMENGGDDAEILTNMYDYSADFKDILDQSSGNELDMLCVRYEGFYKYADIAQNLAQGIKDGKIDVPGGEDRN